MAFSKTLSDAGDMILNYWQKIDLKKWSKDIGGSSAEAVHAALYFLISFAIGFFLKKYLKYVVSGILIAFFLVYFLKFMGIVKIDWGTVKAVTGIGSTGGFDAIMNGFFLWIKSNVLLFAAIIVGLLVGYKLG